MSTHIVPVVRVKLEKHPNADALSLIKLGGFTCCVRTQDWVDGALAAWIEPDSLVDIRRSEFAFLETLSNPVMGIDYLRRIKVKKLRGVPSMGLLVPAPTGSKEGDDVMEKLGVTHYEPPAEATKGGETARGPKRVRVPCYDLENWRAAKYRSAFREGEIVYISEKIHGANSRYLFSDNELHVGSRTEWKKAPTAEIKPGFAKRIALRLGRKFWSLRRWKLFRPQQVNRPTIWHEAVKQNPWISDWCKANPDHTLFGETFGQVQDLRYGSTQGQYFFRAFDVMKPDGTWIDAEVFLQLLPREHRVPVLYIGPYVESGAAKYAEGNSLFPGVTDQIREGCVVKPMKDRSDERAGRVALKIVGNGYLERS